MSEYVTIIDLKLDSETVRLSHAGEQPAEAWYEDRIIEAGSIKRQVQYLPGGVTVADCDLVVSNEGNRFSKLKASTPFKNRVVEIKFGKRSEGLSGLTTVFTGKIEDTDIFPAEAEIAIRDASYDKFQDSVPGKINRVDFPDLPIESPLYLAPIILGEVSSVGGSAQGAVPCYLTTTSNPFLYLVAQHACKSILNVYLYGTVLAPAAYTVTTKVIAGRTYQFISFTTDQRDSGRPNELEITADVQGLMDAGSALITNPVEAFEDLLTDFFGVSSLDIDATRFAAAETSADDESYAVGAWIGGDEPIPMIDVINNFSQSFMMPFFVNRSGQYAVKLLIASDFFDLPGGYRELRDVTDILQDTDESEPEADSTFGMPSNREIASRIRYNDFYNWAFGYWERATDQTNADEESNLGREVLREREYPYVRDISTANKVSATRLIFLTEAKQFAQFSLPISHFDLDLLDYVNVTHYSGIAADGLGYQSATFMITDFEIVTDPTGMEIMDVMVRLVDPVPHCDSHRDQHNDSEHTDAEHTDSAHSDAHTDTEHEDSHQDTHLDEHQDSHCDLETGGHCDHQDGWTHWDIVISWPVHADEHADYHQDFYHDIPHEDSAHGDSHGDVAHTDTAHEDVAHTDTAHSDFHCDNEAEEIFA